MSYFRVKKIKKHGNIYTYYYLVEGYRDKEGKVKQRVLEYYGTNKPEGYKPKGKKKMKVKVGTTKKKEPIKRTELTDEESDFLEETIDDDNEEFKDQMKEEIDDLKYEMKEEIEDVFEGLKESCKEELDYLKDQFKDKEIDKDCYEEEKEAHKQALKDDIVSERDRIKEEYQESFQEIKDKYKDKLEERRKELKQEILDGKHEEQMTRENKEMEKEYEERQKAQSKDILGTTKEVSFKDLNDKEKLVLAELEESAKEQGYDFGITEDVDGKKLGMTGKQISGYISQLVQKGYIQSYPEDKQKGFTQFEFNDKYWMAKAKQRTPLTSPIEYWENQIEELKEESDKYGKKEVRIRLPEAKRIKKLLDSGKPPINEGQKPKGFDKLWKEGIKKYPELEYVTHINIKPSKEMLGGLGLANVDFSGNRVEFNINEEIKTPESIMQQFEHESKHIKEYIVGKEITHKRRY